MTTMTKQAKVCRPIPHERGEVVLIEYDEVRGKPPIRVTVRKGTRYEHFRFVPSERDGCVYVDEDGSDTVASGIHLSEWSQKHPLRPIWYSDGVILRRFLRHQTREEGGGCEYTQVFDARDLAGLGMRRIAEPRALDPFADTRELDGEELVYCMICQDDWADTGNDSLCRHLFYTERGKEGPGCDDLREASDVPESLRAMVRRAGIARTLLGRLSANREPRWSCGNIVAGRRYVDIDEIVHDADDWQAEELLRAGAQWLRSLDAETTAANAAVCAWLREEIAAQDARRASGEAVYGVRSGWWDRGNLRAKRRPYAEAREIAARLRAKGERDVRVVCQVPKAVKQAG